MRKTLILTCALFLLSVCTIAGLHFTIDGQKNQVEMTETTVTGNRSAAEGINVKLNARDNTADINWDLEYGFDNDGTFNTEVVFSAKNKPSETYDEEKYIHIEPAIDSAGQSDSIPEELPYKALLQDELADMSSGQEKVICFKAADYYDTLPVVLNCGGDLTSKPDYFQIPVPQNMEMTLSVSKAPSGNMFTYNTDFGFPFGLNFDDAGQIIGKNGYLAITRMDFDSAETGNSSSLLPKKTRGISCIPMQYNKSLDQYLLHPTPKMDEARLVYPLSEDTRILALETDYQKENLLLLTLENQKIYLTVLKPLKDGALEKVQKLKLLNTSASFIPAPTTGFTFTLSETCMSLILHNNGNFCAAAKENGSYRVITSGNLLKDAQFPSELTRSVKELYDSGSFFAAAYDGSRTIITLPQPLKLPIIYLENIPINHYLLVFKGNHLSYMGKIDFSLNDKVYLNPRISIELKG